MVSILSIIAIIFGAVVIFGFPVLLMILLSKKANKLIVPLFAGVTSFFVMQILFRMPMLQLSIQSSHWDTLIHPVFYALILGFSAAVFETAGRYFTMKLFMRNDTRFTAGVAHGIGHGATEAVLIVGINYLVYIVYAIMINNGTFEQILNMSGSAQQDLEFLQDTLLNTHFSGYLLGTFERVMIMLFHISMSVLTLFAIKKKKLSYLFIVVLIHTFLDTFTVILVQNGVNVYIIELFILVVVMLSSYGTLKIYKKYKNQAPE
jgi:uncharacterized membrane protein YhfC